jgi:hypothetical protein
VRARTQRLEHGLLNLQAFQARPGPHWRRRLHQLVARAALNPLRRRHVLLALRKHHVLFDDQASPLANGCFFAGVRRTTHMGACRALRASSRRQDGLVDDQAPHPEIFVIRACTHAVWRESERWSSLAIA